MSETDERSFGNLGRPDALAPMIDFRGADGTSYALAYSELLSVALTSPGCIVMEFRKHKVVVRGRNLTAVYRGLVGHTVAYLQEDDFDLAPESEVFVDSLAIEPRAE